MTTTQVKTTQAVDREAHAHELSDGSPEARAAILDRVRQIRTRGDAVEYTPSACSASGFGSPGSCPASQAEMDDD